MLLRMLLAAVMVLTVAGPLGTAAAAPPTKTVVLDVGGLH